ncbi:lipoxygenase family protein [Limnovirga soli]|uniref:Lipoxygenase domain-containing protein n=1 Tax=Limnovirga soli TaxID=2656915 RepID=A0A8J8FI21_9BACT|nr:lipoxygenase family protein [Limnovirga soli]NNV56992.1 hypothetical protein [Limnovirga soli]
MTKAEIDEIIESCFLETKIVFGDKGHFFSPKLGGINYLEVGKSKIIRSWVTIMAERLYRWIDRLKDAIEKWWKGMTPRTNVIYGSVFDSSLVGTLTFARPGDIAIPIHNKRVQLWARTKFFKWRKLGEAISAQDGSFVLPFDLRAARAWVIRKKLHVEIYQITDVVNDNGQMIPNKIVFKTLFISKKDLIGMEYNLRDVQLFFWEYRDDTPLPRVVIKDDGTDVPESYTHGRVEAMSEQLIPIEITKQKHLLQIARDPSSIDVYEIQSDYPKNLTVAIEEKLPGYTRGDDWFGERMMNGMNMATFLQDKTDPAFYWVKYFGACNYEVNDEYAFPSVEIKFTLKEDGLPLPVEIHLTGPLNAINKDPFQKIVVTPQDGDKWLQAKRVARVSGALCAELDQHLAGTHLNTEQYSIAIHRNLRLNPVVLLLMPHVKSVALIDKDADRLLIHGYIPNATALTVKGAEERACDLLGLQDWKGWKPMKQLSEAHIYAKAEDLFCEVVREWVDLFFEQNEFEIKKQWFEIYRFSEELVEHAVPFFPSTVDLSAMSPEEKDFTQRRLEYLLEEYRVDINSPRVTINGELKAVSPITNSPVFDENSDDWQNLKDCCCYIITTATFLHTWVNEHQYEDIGEVLYSCLGLRFGTKPHGIMAPESDLSIAPDATRSTQMMWFSNLLSRTEYGFILKNEQGDMFQEFMDLLAARKDEFAKLKVDVEQIESRTNI